MTKLHTCTGGLAQVSGIGNSTLHSYNSVLRLTNVLLVLKATKSLINVNKLTNAMVLMLFFLTKPIL